ncbi:VOC family protein [Rothia sp. AR01]|uniref:VOC family protein n=1 Tax=Rothia santali TaxID=2949643 RepID=A0A9X2HB98_9MICC|nr:VOC family protein [Rothia santali]MCP3426464.1 VOC family protein [Rothia santali]
MSTEPTSETVPQASGVGSPVWLELTTDQAGLVRDFYARLLGWRVTDEEMPGFGMIYQGETLVGGFIDSTRFDNFGASDAEGVPNAWTVYLRTDDLDAALAAVEETDGRVLMPIRDVEGQGRFSIVSAPDGAVLGVWELGEFDGLAFPMTPGSPVWFETLSTDYDAAVPFYERALGWNVVPMGGEDGGEGDVDEGGVRYATHGPDGEGGAGICAADSFLPDGVPSFWRAYFLVEETDAAVRTVQELGGHLLDGPMDSPFGRVATVADPGGATFQLVDGHRAG